MLALVREGMVCSPSLSSRFSNLKRAEGPHMKVLFKLLAACVTTRHQRLLERERHPCYGSETQLIWTVRKNQTVLLVCLQPACLCDSQSIPFPVSETLLSTVRGNHWSPRFQTKQCCYST